MKIYPFDLIWVNQIKLLERWLDYWLKTTGLEMEYEISLSDLTRSFDAHVSTVLVVDFTLSNSTDKVIYTGLVDRKTISGGLRQFTKDLVLKAYEGLCTQQNQLLE